MEDPAVTLRRELDSQIHRAQSKLAACRRGLDNEVRIGAASPFILGAADRVLSVRHVRGRCSAAGSFGHIVGCLRNNTLVELRHTKDDAFHLTIDLTDALGAQPPPPEDAETDHPASTRHRHLVQDIGVAEEAVRLAISRLHDALVSGRASLYPGLCPGDLVLPRDLIESDVAETPGLMAGAHIKADTGALHVYVCRLKAPDGTPSAVTAPISTAVVTGCGDLRQLAHARTAGACQASQAAVDASDPGAFLASLPRDPEGRWAASTRMMVYDLGRFREVIVTVRLDELVREYTSVRARPDGPQAARVFEE